MTVKFTWLCFFKVSLNLSCSRLGRFYFQLLIISKNENASIQQNYCFSFNFLLSNIKMFLDQYLDLLHGKQCFSSRNVLPTLRCNSPLINFDNDGQMSTSVHSWTVVEMAWSWRASTLERLLDNGLLGLSWLGSWRRLGTSVLNSGRHNRIAGLYLLS